MNEAPIGIFDSGVGGLTVWHEIVQLLPAENTLYLADSAHAPYGERPAEEIRALSRKNTEWLLDHGCKIIVVACNTATTNAIALLRGAYPVPFIGIEPAIKPAALNSRTGKVGVLATRGTLASDLFAETSKAHAGGIRILEQEGVGLVRLIEAGNLEDPALTTRLETLLAPMLEAGIDQLVLGCTHYPFLIPALRGLLPENVKIVDCGLPVARQTQAVLAAKGWLRDPAQTGVHQLYTNGDPEVMDRLLQVLGHREKCRFASF